MNEVMFCKETSLTNRTDNISMKRFLVLRKRVVIFQQEWINNERGSNGNIISGKTVLNLSREKKLGRNIFPVVRNHASRNPINLTLSFVLCCNFFRQSVESKRALAQKPRPQNDICTGLSCHKQSYGDPC